MLVPVIAASGDASAPAPLTDTVSWHVRAVMPGAPAPVPCGGDRRAEILEGVLTRSGGVLDQDPDSGGMIVSEPRMRELARRSAIGIMRQISLFERRGCEGVAEGLLDPEVRLELIGAAQGACDLARCGWGPGTMVYDMDSPRVVPLWSYALTRLRSGGAAFHAIRVYHVEL